MAVSRSLRSVALRLALPDRRRITSRHGRSAHACIRSTGAFAREADGMWVGSSGG